MIANDPTHFSPLFQPYPDLKSLVAIPLLLNGEVIGTLQVVNKPGGFTEADTHLLRLFADQAAIAITNAQLHEQAKQQAVDKERQQLAIEDVLYKVAQEALNNVVKEAKAEQVTVHLHFTEQQRQLTIQDDGVGFDPAIAQGGGAWAYAVSPNGSSRLGASC